MGMCVCASVCVSAPSVMPLTDGTTAAAINVLFLLLKITTMLSWMVNRCFFLMSEWSPLCCQVHQSTSCSMTRVWDAKYMWGVWESSQVLILTFEFSSAVSRWPRHLMPLHCFSSSPLFVFLPIPSLSFPFSFLSVPHFPPCIQSSTPSPLHISLSTLFPCRCLHPPSFCSLSPRWVTEP